MQASSEAGELSLESPVSPPQPKLEGSHPLRVYVAGPLSGREVDYIANCGRIDAACADVMALGCAPFNPAADRLLGMQAEYSFPVEAYKAASLAWLACSDVMYVCGDATPGVRAEIEFCRERGIPVVWSTEELAQVRGTEL